MRNSYDDEPVSFDELPDLVNAADEGLYRRILVTLLIDQGLDVRFAYGNIMDEYHDVPLNEMYEDYVPLTYDESDYERDENGYMIVLVPKEAMIAYAVDDLAYYTTHEPTEHEDGDITKPSKRTIFMPEYHEEGDYVDPDCMRCQLDEEFAFEDQLIAMPLEERVTRLRAYLDQFMPEGYQPYEIAPTEYNVYIYRVTHDGREIGSVQFNDTLNQIVVPLGTTAPAEDEENLFNAQQVFKGRKTLEEMREETRAKYPDFFKKDIS